METIIGAAIAGVVAVVTCLINNNMQRAKEQHSIEMQIQAINANYDKSTALIEQKIEALSVHVNKHNQLVERMYDCEKLTAHISDLLAGLDERVDRLEGDDRR